MSDDFSAWVGKCETIVDVLDPARTNALRVALGETAQLVKGDILPPLHHWLYFWNVQPTASLGADGHPAKGGFLPPVPLPRRMWAGGRVSFAAPLCVGDRVEKRSTILMVETKTGKSGTLVFVTLEHRLTGPEGEAIVEEQDIVYREAAATATGMPAMGTPVPIAAWHAQLTPDPVLLFRYSALTMNGHRIHYDRCYAMDEEAYPALVVHGPLQATLLAAMAHERLGRPLARFDFRGQSPAFDGVALHVCGELDEKGARLWTAQGGATCMAATAR